MAHSQNCSSCLSIGRDLIAESAERAHAHAVVSLPPAAVSLLSYWWWRQRTGTAASRSNLPGKSEHLITAETEKHRDEADKAVADIAAGDDDEEADEDSNREHS